MPRSAAILADLHALKLIRVVVLALLVVVFMLAIQSADYSAPRLGELELNQGNGYFFYT